MNISEFAEIAGVSKSAVSRYFNKGYLSEEKRVQIEEAIEKTGYAPSISAQNVRTRVTKLVGVILPKLSSESCARVTEGISEVLSEHGYQLLLMNTSNDFHKEIEYLELFRQNRVDGVIFLASIFTPLHKKVLHKMRIPVVIVGQECKGYHCVCHDDYSVAKTLTELMIQKGGKIPGYIGVTEKDASAGLARRNGFIKALQEAELHLLPEHVFTGEFTLESGYEQAERMFRKKPYPDFIFCATDNIAAGVMKYCRKKCICIPEEVMVCGVGDSQFCEVLSVSLTSAHLHYKTAGIEAAEMLLSAIKRNALIPKVMKLDFYIEERDSTRKYETV